MMTLLVPLREKSNSLCSTSLRCFNIPHRKEETLSPRFSLCCLVPENVHEMVIRISSAEKYGSAIVVLQLIIERGGGDLEPKNRKTQKNEKKVTENISGVFSVK